LEFDTLQAATATERFLFIAAVTPAGVILTRSEAELNQTWHQISY